MSQARMTPRALRLLRLRQRAVHLGLVVADDTAADPNADPDPDPDPDDLNVDPDTVSAEDISGR